jgi:phage gp45-like
MGSGMGQVILATNEKVKQARAAGHNFEAPNQARESNRQSIDFQGNLNISGAPAGSTFSSKTRGAPPIQYEITGPNKLQ